jgi:hypothetical protein
MENKLNLSGEEGFHRTISSIIKPPIIEEFIVSHYFPVNILQHDGAVMSENIPIFATF